MATETVRLQQQRQRGSSSSSGSNIESRLTEEQIENLERQFSKTKNPHPSEMMLIAAETGVDEEVVKAWFGHRMAMWRRDQGLNPVSGRLS